MVSAEFPPGVFPVAALLSESTARFGISSAEPIDLKVFCSRLGHPTQKRNGRLGVDGSHWQGSQPVMVSYEEAYSTGAGCVSSPLCKPSKAIVLA